jgi:hypothetical protein
MTHRFVRAARVTVRIYYAPMRAVYSKRSLSGHRSEITIFETIFNRARATATNGSRGETRKVDRPIGPPATVLGLLEIGTIKNNKKKKKKKKKCSLTVIGERNTPRSAGPTVLGARCRVLRGLLYILIFLIH